ncbi:flavin-linked sulfhydryl oxidase [Aspergillus melleus]|uniref:flavin-linked sulfhydryl oxidase n=1 Tax=Aspergillus melleus TaxID=138277 RepID=UPI001E8EC813|nr:Flavin-linked sulfhydryl oxidase of the mitochondrial IMS [Aspergillus melleus]KAH8426837.1 Flavin-linked sulfhydryl oxidase of the mitochondrial IMS [Aspergillus melleus]
MAEESQPRPFKSPFPHQPAATASSSTDSKDDDSKTKLANGVVLDKDGKPYVQPKSNCPDAPPEILTQMSSRCRLCTSAASWRSLTKQAKASGAASTAASTSSNDPVANPPSSNPTPSRNECPPDVENLGRSTWTLLHSMTATYPTKATTEQQTEMRTFLKLFSRLYPCWVCADDFRTWMAEPSGKNQPRLGGRADFGTWMCEAHNEVNRKLGKKEFDCRFWEERWRTGWKDGRCD